MYNDFVRHLSNIANFVHVVNVQGKVFCTLTTSDGEAGDPYYLVLNLMMLLMLQLAYHIVAYLT